MHGHRGKPARGGGADARAHQGRPLGKEARTSKDMASKAAWGGSADVGRGRRWGEAWRWSLSSLVAQFETLATMGMWQRRGGPAVSSYGSGVWRGGDGREAVEAKAGCGGSAGQGSI